MFHCHLCALRRWTREGFCHIALCQDATWSCLLQLLGAWRIQSLACWSRSMSDSWSARTAPTGPRDAECGLCSVCHREEKCLLVFNESCTTKVSQGCHVQVGNDIELDTVCHHFKPNLWLTCYETWDAVPKYWTVVVTKLWWTSAFSHTGPWPEMWKVLNVQIYKQIVKKLANDMKISEITQELQYIYIYNVANEFAYICACLHHPYVEVEKEEELSWICGPAAIVFPQENSCFAREQCCPSILS